MSSESSIKPHWHVSLVPRLPPSMRQGEEAWFPGYHPPWDKGRRPGSQATALHETRGGGLESYHLSDIRSRENQLCLGNFVLRMTWRMKKMWSIQSQLITYIHMCSEFLAPKLTQKAGGRAKKFDHKESKNHGVTTWYLRWGKNCMLPLFYTLFQAPFCLLCLPVTSLT